MRTLDSPPAGSAAPRAPSRRFGAILTCYAGVLLAGFGLGHWAFRNPAAKHATGSPSHLAGGIAPPGAEPAPTLSSEQKAHRLMAAALRKGRSIDRESELYAAIQAFTADDFRHLLTDVGAIKAMVQELRGMHSGTARHLAAGLFDRWAAVDPDAIATWAPRVLGWMSDEKQIREIILSALASKRPDVVLSMVASEKDAKMRAGLIARGVRELAATDNAQARAWVQACTDPAERRVAENAFRLGSVKADPLRALEFAGQTSSQRELIEMMTYATEAAVAQGEGTLRQLAMSAANPTMLGAVLQEFAERDPELAMQLALKQVTSGDTDYDQNYCLERAFSALARRDPAAAVTRLEGLEGKARSSAVAALGEEWLRQDPGAALDWLSSLPAVDRENDRSTSYGSSDSLLISFSEWFSADAAGARTWADSLPPSQDCDDVQTQVARMLAAEGDPGEATRILAQLSGTADQQVFGEIATSWARKDPQAAAAWAVAQPPGPLQSRALASVVSAWANEDSAAAEAWLAQFPPGETRDRCVSAYLLRPSLWSSGLDAHLAEFDTWFGTMEDPWYRAQAALRSFWLRRRSDPDGAREWLTSLPNVDSAVVAKTLDSL